MNPAHNSPLYCDVQQTTDYTEDDRQATAGPQDIPGSSQEKTQKRHPAIRRSNQRWN
jgi:hypothetical protein